MNVNKKLTRFIEWTALPDKLKEPSTQEELAEELKRKPETLERWSRSDEFQLQVDKAIGRRLLKRKANIYEAIREKAEGGDFRFIKLLLEMMHHYPVPKEAFTEKVPLPKYTVEDYAKAMEDVRAWLREKARKEKEQSS